MTVSYKSSTCFKKDGEPRSAYHSEYAAKEAALYVKMARGLDLTWYQCPTCDEWHLSPRDRQTPSTTCPYCIDSKGRPKQLYETRGAAENRARIIERERGLRLEVYECPHYFRRYHLTHR